jgi:hypothetical protein
MWSLAENVNPGRRCVHHADGLECREELSAFSSQLQAYRQQLPAGRKLVFGKLGGREDAPDGHLLRRLKILVKKAGLGCGTCATCLAKTGCENWWLHKFRATYITTLLRSGMDLRTTRRLSGHADLESVMRYLRPVGTVESQCRQMFLTAAEGAMPTRYVPLAIVAGQSLDAGAQKDRLIDKARCRASIFYMV